MSSGKLAHRPTPVSVSLLAAAIAGALAVLAASPAYAQAVPEPQDTEQLQPAAQASEPAADEEATELDAVVVTGLRSSLQSAQTIKQNSEQIVDSIVAEDIGKLPDITASASLARVPGVQVTRASGEAADVQVRGLPNLTTTYNGRELFTAENRSVALQDFPAGGVAALDVYKSSTAELVEPGIAGLINVRSRRPFDFDGFEISGSANMIYADQADTPDVNGNFLISNRWQTGIGEMGLLVNGAWNEIRFLDSTREESLVMGVAQPGQTDQPGFRFPDAVATYYGSGRRTRPSLNAAFQWKPNDRWEINADMLFQGFRSRDANSFMFVPLFTGDTQFSDVVTEPGASGDQAQSFTATGGLRPDGFESAVDARTNTYQVGLGAVYRNGGVRWSGDIAATDSTFELHEANIDFAFASTPVRDVQFDAPGGDGGPTFSFRDFDLRDPNNFVFRGLFDRNYRAEGSDVQARTDFEFAPESGFITAYQAGLRATDRDASRRAGQRYAFWEPNGLRYTDLPVALAYTGGGFEGDDHAPPRYWIAPNRNSIRWNLDELRAIVGFPAGDPEFADADTFEANERAYTAYGQIKYAFDAGSVPIDRRPRGADRNRDHRHRRRRTADRQQPLYRHPAQCQRAFPFRRKVPDPRGGHRDPHAAQFRPAQSGHVHRHAAGHLLLRSGRSQLLPVRQRRQPGPGSAGIAQLRPDLRVLLRADRLGDAVAVPPRREGLHLADDGRHSRSRLQLRAPDPPGEWRRGPDAGCRVRVPDLSRLRLRTGMGARVRRAGELHLYRRRCRARAVPGQLAARQAARPGCVQECLQPGADVRAADILGAVGL
jgi:hypothetical protein